MEAQESKPWVRDCAWCGGAPGTPSCGSRSHWGGADPAVVAVEAEEEAEALRQRLEAERNRWRRYPPTDGPPPPTGLKYLEGEDGQALPTAALVRCSNCGTSRLPRSNAQCGTCGADTRTRSR